MGYSLQFQGTYSGFYSQNNCVEQGRCREFEVIESRILNPSITRVKVFANKKYSCVRYCVYTKRISCISEKGIKIDYENCLLV